jgi:type IV pilus assembly protein PilW
MNQYKKEMGVTLVELLVGLSVGFIVVGGIIGIYSNTAGSSASTIKGAILNQEMNAIMQLVTNDLRRAGYWLDTNTTDTTDDNPFTDQNYVYNTTISTWSSQPCITYAYDLDQDSSVGIGSLTVSGDTFADAAATPKEDTDNMEIFGFRYNATDGALEMRTGGSGGTAAAKFNCSDGSWEDLNDPTVVTITAFTIDSTGTNCTDTSIDTTPTDWTTTGTNTAFCSDTTAANFTPGPTGTDDIVIAATDSIVEVRQINITLTGELASDASVKKSLTRAIRVRNNRLITRSAITIPNP